jgi:hypothetical protein
VKDTLQPKAFKNGSASVTFSYELIASYEYNLFEIARTRSKAKEKLPA